MKIADLQKGVIAIELPRIYSRDELITLALSFGLRWSVSEQRKYLRSYRYLTVFRGEFIGRMTIHTGKYDKVIRLSDIEPC
jgi:hypothetical protein